MATHTTVISEDLLYAPKDKDSTVVNKENLAKETRHSASTKILSKDARDELHHSVVQKPKKLKKTKSKTRINEHLV